MQKGINYPFRKYVRLSADQNDRLAKLAKLSHKPENVVLRNIIDAGLNPAALIAFTKKPDPKAISLLKKWARKFSKSRNQHPGHQNWNAIDALASDTETFLADVVSKR